MRDNLHPERARMSTRERMSSVDTAWLRMDRPNNLMMIVGVMVFAGRLDYDRLLLEYDSERAGSFDPLRFVRKGTVVVLGLVTTKSGEMETLDGLRRRIDAAARFCPLDQLALSPQCGFASGIGGNALSVEAQWRKIDLIVETARKVWG